MLTGWLLVWSVATMAAPTLAGATGVGPIEFNYAKFSNLDDPREKLPLAVLELAMAKMQLKFSAKPCPDVMERSRALIELEQGRCINLIWTSMAAEAEKNLRPIRIPIYRGLIGHRLFLIHKNQQQAFAKIRNLDDLRKFNGGVGLGWVDGKIMEQAGLRVVRDKYDSLFRLLDNESIDYFPRGANEVFAELNGRQKTQPNLMVEPGLMLVYKSDVIFYLNKKDEALASQIEKGLLMAYEDGSYLKLFNEHPYVLQVLRDAGLDKRLRLELPNPMLSDEDRAIAARFWMK
jgi:hypothetical protein